MKKNKKILIIIPLLIIYIYIYNILAIPNHVVLLDGENINYKTFLGLKIENAKTSLTSSNLNQSKINDVQKNNLSVSLLGQTVKNINVDVISKTEVIPLGQAIGMKLYTKGVLVVGMSELETENGTKEKPYKDSGIEEGDSILYIDDYKIENTEEVIKKVNESNGRKLKIMYSRGDKVLETSITPVKVKDEYKLGLWIRDAAAGIGTLTFYEPSTNLFMSLGHGIEDIDTKEIVNISNGELVNANIISIVKGKKDYPGEIKGTLSNSSSIGNIYKNTNFGVYGKLKNKTVLSNLKPVEVASREEIKEGKATMICQIDNNSPKEYEIEIERIYLNDNTDNKSMLIKITDKELLEKTGGIIQGMSGAPIIQNGKFIGAVTNVLVKDPTQGYAIFADLMIKQIRDV